jgi:hypothetical protein
MNKFYKHLKKNKLNRHDISDFLENIKTNRKRLKFGVCNFFSYYLSAFILVLRCASCRNQINKQKRDHPDFALLKLTKEKFSTHLDAVLMMRQLRDHSIILKSLLTKR